jgi:hypothetical protein
MKFAEVSSVTSILSNRNHTINGTHVVMRSYHQDTTNSNSTQLLPSLMTLNQQNQNSLNNNNNGQKPIPYDQLLQENLTLKYEITTLQHSLAEAQTYSKTAYDTFQALREKFGNFKIYFFIIIISVVFFLFKEAEQSLTSKLKLEHVAMIESYEARLKQLPAPPPPLPPEKIVEKDKVKEEPFDCDPRQTNSSNYLLEMQVIKDRLEQAQIDLGFFLKTKSLFFFNSLYR